MRVSDPHDADIDAPAHASTSACGKKLFEDLPDEPQMTERIDDGALQHPCDRVGSERRVRVFYENTSGPDYEAVRYQDDPPP